jgi:Tfp pilus assembly protein PilO
MSRLSRLTVRSCIMCLMVVASSLSTGCLDLAVMGMNAAIRDSQNRERIRQEQQIDAQRAARDFALQEQVRRLQRQNEELLRQRE